MTDGCADISIVLSTTLTDDDISRLRFDETEYSEHKFVSCDEVLADVSYHPALRTAVADLKALVAWRSLQRAVHSECNGDAVYRAALELVHAADRSVLEAATRSNQPRS